MIAHGDARTDILTYSKVGLKFAHISDALLVDFHEGKECGLLLIPR